MDEQTIRQIVTEVLSGVSAPCCGGEIPIEVSARHVHLTTEAVEQLFGKGARLTSKRGLSQPGEFLSEQRVKLVTPSGDIANVAVLGPERAKIQVELSLTDARQLGITAPINLSGDLTGGGTVYIVGEKAMLKAENSVIAAKSHIHMTPADAESYHVRDGQQVSVAVDSLRPVTLRGVVVRVNPGYALAMHIDFDEANACAASCGAKGRLLAAEGGLGESASAKIAPKPMPASAEIKVKVVTEAVALEIAASGSKAVFLPKGVLITPSARDIFIHKGIRLEQR